MLHLVVFTFFYRPQRSCEGYVFTTVCHSVHRGGLTQYMLGYHTPPGTRHPQGPDTPRNQAPPPPASRRLLLRTVRILLECNLVCLFLYRQKVKNVFVSDR